MKNKVFGIPKSVTAWSCEKGDILIVRKLKDRNDDYGVMGLWSVIEIERATVPYYWPGEWSINIYMEPIIEFEVPFNEDIRRVRYEDNSLGGSISSKVEGLKGRPHLNLSIYNMVRSEENIQVLINYFEAILKEKKYECNFGNFEFLTPVDNDLITNFIEELESFVKNKLKE